MGFSHRHESLETDVRTFLAEKSQKSPAEFKKTPVFLRLAPETLEQMHCVCGTQSYASFLAVQRLLLAT